MLASVTYSGNGSQTIYNFGFDYLRPSFVKVFVGNTALTYNKDYIVNQRQVEFTVAPTGTVRIYRETPTDRMVEWSDTSILKASNLTVQQVQTLHILEEQQDWLQLNTLYLAKPISNLEINDIFNKE